MNNGNQDFAARSEQHAGVRIINIAVRIAADRWRCDNFARISVCDNHYFVASRKQAVVLQVNRQSGGAFARSEWPRSLNLKCLGIEFCKGAGGLDVDEHVALTI